MTALRFILLVCTLAATIGRTYAQWGTPPPVPPLPEPRQLQWQRLEFVGFLHFGVNTFTDREWGYGDEAESLFVPTDFDADQIARTAKLAGMGELIITAKHHDGFCLWPSKYTGHSVKNSPWRNGTGDVVREIAEACRRYGLRFGVYLSPWDCNHAAYGRPEYIEYYRNQLHELLTEYGAITEVWFDGANGGRGFYGGARAIRTIDRSTYYGWDTTWEMVRTLQPDAVMFSDVGPDIRWVGNENGYANETCWSPYSPVNETGGPPAPGLVRTADGMSGHEHGARWIPAECDVSIRPGWFYHQREDTLVKSPETLFDLYLKSTGRNSLLLLNIPPDRRGRIAVPDSISLMGFRRLRENAFAHDLARGAAAATSSLWSNNPHFGASSAVDGNPDSYWAGGDTGQGASLAITLRAQEVIACAVLGEPISLGQRVSSFHLEIPEGNRWRTVASGSTIGNKRILLFPPVRTRKVRLLITGSRGTPLISSFELYHDASQQRNRKGAE